MAWQQISVTVNEQAAPLIDDFFTEQGAVSVTYMDAEDKPIFEPPLNTIQAWQNTRVIALFEIDELPEDLHAQFAVAFPQLDLTTWQQSVLADQVWEQSWLAHFQPLLFANKLWVCPTGMEQHTPGTVCMTLDPGLAFGTGTHPTTALCLDWLASHSVRGKTVIDFGCGSGILAIAAVLLGANISHAIDIDPQALTATQSNSVKNQVQAQVLVYLPEQFIHSPADVVVANILAKPLIELQQHITSLVNPGGQLVLSGILAEQAQAVMNAYQGQIIFAPPVMQDEWCRLTGYKPG